MATKKHNIDILVAADNINILNTLTQVLPDINDPRLWIKEYRLKIISHDDLDYIEEFKDAFILNGHICFESIIERTNAMVALRATQGLYNNCREGSYIREVLSDHELPINERTGSQIIKQSGRDSSGKGPDSKGIYVEDFIAGVSQGRVYS